MIPATDGGIESGKISASPLSPYRRGQITTPTPPVYFGQGPAFQYLPADHRVRGLYYAPGGQFDIIVGLGKDLSTVNPYHPITDRQRHHQVENSRGYAVQIDKAGREEAPRLLAEAQYHFFVIDGEGEDHTRLFMDYLARHNYLRSGQVVSVVERKEGLTERIARAYAHLPLRFARGERHGDTLEPHLGAYFRVNIEAI